MAADHHRHHHHHHHHQHCLQGLTLLACSVLKFKAIKPSFFFVFLVHVFLSVDNINVAWNIFLMTSSVDVSANFSSFSFLSKIYGTRSQWKVNFYSWVTVARRLGIISLKGCWLEWAAIFLFYIGEVPETGYLDSSRSLHSSVPPGNGRDSPKK
jgi:hypothetical protein